MDLSNLNVGDRVVTQNDTIGIIKRITPTGRIVVDFGNYESRFGKDGWELGNGSVWFKTRIDPLTTEREQKILDAKTIRLCIKYFDTHHNLLTPEKAMLIMQILKGEDNE